MPTYTPLMSVELTTNPTTVTFNNIPQIYQDLVLVSNAGATTGNNNIAAYINGLTTGYSLTFLNGSGAAATTSRATNEGRLTFDDRGAMSNDLGCTNITHFMNYSNTTTHKVMLSRAGNASASGSTSSPYGVSIAANTWRSTNAITSITLFPSGSNQTFTIGSTFSLYGIEPGTNKAQGGLMFADSTYWYHAFTASDLFITSSDVTADILVIAGGGGGGIDNTGAERYGQGVGGGGAGGVLLNSSVSLKGNKAYSVTVGAGGNGGTLANYVSTNGSNSTVSGDVLSITAAVGGGAGYSSNSDYSSSGGNSGGSGGAGGATSGSGGSGTSGQGNAGGRRAISDVGYYNGGGGGGAAAAGANGSTSGSTGGAGGAGTSTYSTWGLQTQTGQNVSGTVYYGGGGGGDGAGANSTGGSGGNGGGGAGNGTSGTANTGGGGGAVRGTLKSSAGNGGSGLVIIRYTR